MLKIRRESRKIPVYDIEVEDNHNFFANGICVHNCESFSPARPSTIKESKYNKETNEYTEVWDTGLYHTCNLASLNVSRMKNIEEIEKYARQATRILDNAIDITVVPVAEGQKM